MTYLANEDIKKEQPYLDLTESLMEELQKAKRRLAKLYEFDDEKIDDDVLKEKIADARLRILDIQDMLRDAEKKAEEERKIQKTKTILKNIETTWPAMSQEEKQTVCRELIERIDIYKNGAVDVTLRLNKYIVNQ